MSNLPILPARLVDELTTVIEREQRDVARYVNREPFDESGIYGLVQFMATVYEAGHEDGFRMHSALDRAERRAVRTRDELAAGQSDE